jgi:hypothetical protein
MSVFVPILAQIRCFRPPIRSFPRAFPITRAFFRSPRPPDFLISRCPDFLTPPPIALLLKIKAKSHFDRTVTDRSNPLFGFVSTLNHVVSFPAFADRHFPDCQPLIKAEHKANQVLRVAHPSTNVKRIMFYFEGFSVQLLAFFVFSPKPWVPGMNQKWRWLFCM